MPAPALPPLALAAPAACAAAAAALANCALLAALLRLAKTGLYCIIFQLAIVDFILLITTIAPELWTWYHGSWSLGQEACVAYRGLSVLASTASVYLITAIALHTLATVNLEEKALTKKLKRINRDEEDELRSSRHSLVASSDTSTPPRTMQVDYRVSDVRVPVGPPSVFVWVLSASVSVPQFIMSTVVHEGEDTAECTLQDSSHRLNMHALLVIFTLILPITIIVITGILTIIKIKSVKNKDIDSESVSALRFSILMIIVCCFMSMPRSIMEVYSFHNIDSKRDTASLIVISVYLISTLVRPLLSAFMLQPLRQIFSFNSNLSVDNV